MVIGKKGYRKEKTQLWICAKSFINFAPLPEFEPVTSRINRHHLGSTVFILTKIYSDLQRFIYKKDSMKFASKD